MLIVARRTSFQNPLASVFGHLPALHYNCASPMTELNNTIFNKSSKEAGYAAE